MPRGFEELAAMLSHLTAQTIADRLEVVLVHTPAGTATIDHSAFAPFLAFKQSKFPRYRRSRPDSSPVSRPPAHRSSLRSRITYSSILDGRSG
jgi:hypothetical protein